MSTAVIRLLVVVMMVVMASAAVAQEKRSCSTCFGNCNRTYSACLASAKTSPARNACLTSYRSCRSRCDGCTWGSAPETGGGYRESTQAEKPSPPSP